MSKPKLQNKTFIVWLAIAGAVVYGYFAIKSKVTGASSEFPVVSRIPDSVMPTPYQDRVPVPRANPKRFQRTEIDPPYDHGYDVYAPPKGGRRSGSPHTGVPYLWRPFEGSGNPDFPNAKGYYD